jgi:hypothetical protein
MTDDDNLAIHFRPDTTSLEKYCVSDELDYLSAKIPHLRSRSERLLGESRRDLLPSVQCLLKDSQKLDDDLESWRNGLQPPWTYTSESSMRELGGLFENMGFDSKDEDTYADISVAKCWNVYRISRIFVQSIILGCAVWIMNGELVGCHLTDSNSYATSVLACIKARGVMNRLVEEICASVPYHLGLTSKDGQNYTYPPPASAGRKSKSQSQFTEPPNHDQGHVNISTDHFRWREPMTHLQIPGGYLLFWPLFVARSVHITPASRKEWIDGHLMQFAARIGLDHEIMVSKLQAGFGWPLLELGPSWEGLPVD